MHFLNSESFKNISANKITIHAKLLSYWNENKSTYSCIITDLIAVPNLQTMIFSLILVITPKMFNLHIFIKWSINIPTTFDIKLDIWQTRTFPYYVVEKNLEKNQQSDGIFHGRSGQLYIYYNTMKWFFSDRLEVHVNTLNIIHVMSFK